MALSGSLMGHVHLILFKLFDVEDEDGRAADGHLGLPGTLRVRHFGWRAGVGLTVLAHALEHLKHFVHPFIFYPQQ